MCQRVLRRGFVALVLLAGFCATSAADKEEKVEEIPLKSVYANFKQDGVQVLEYGSAKANDKARPRDASNLFLVPGKDIEAARKHTEKMFSGRGTVSPVADRGSKSLWMVVYLGVAQSNPAWAVESAQRRGTTIRVSVKWLSKREETKGAYFCFVWVPLGELPAGRYTLELFSVEEKDVTLMRRVSVTK